jgi:hypothetical protein
MSVAQAIPQIDTAGAEKSPFRTETKYNKWLPVWQEKKFQKQFCRKNFRQPQYNFSIENGFQL